MKTKSRPKSVLVVEDEADMRSLILYHLRKERFEVSAAGTAREGLDMARSGQPSVAVLDVVLPDGEGYDLCRAIKEDPDCCKPRIIMLSARSEEENIVRCFRCGADDFMRKPFRPREMVARIAAATRRQASPEQGAKGRRIEIPPLVVDNSRHEASVQGRRLNLTLSEFRLLSLLASHPGRVFDRSALSAGLPGAQRPSPEGFGRSVDVHIRSLRKKLGSMAELIATSRGVGYFLKKHPSDLKRFP